MRWFDFIGFNCEEKKEAKVFEWIGNLMREGKKNPPHIKDNFFARLGHILVSYK